MDNKKKTKSIKIEKPSILQKAEKHSVEIKTEETKKTGRAGRQKLPLDQKASETVTLKLTPKEKQRFTEKAGIVPLGTYLKNYLKTETDLLN